MSLQYGTDCFPNTDYNTKWNITPQSVKFLTFCGFCFLLNKQKVNKMDMNGLLKFIEQTKNNQNVQ